MYLNDSEKHPIRRSFLRLTQTLRHYLNPNLGLEIGDSNNNESRNNQKWIFIFSSGELSI